MSPPFVHPTAFVDAGAEIGPGAKLWHFVHVSEDARVGAGSSLGQNVFVGRGVRVGAGVKVQNNVSIYEGVEIEDEVFLGPSVVFTNVLAPRAFIDRKSEYRRTRVGRGASIGANATLVCGHDVGEYAFVAAGAVITRPVKPFALVMGNPGRRVGWVCRCGWRLSEGGSPTCRSCGDVYTVEGESCRLATPGPGSAARSVARTERSAEESPPRPAPSPIPLVDVRAQNAPILPAIRAAIDAVIEGGQFILGETVAAFEREAAAYLKVPFAIGVSSGSDALLAALMALGVGPGDEIVTSPFSFIATAEAIARLGATPVFADIDPLTMNLAPETLSGAIGPRTKAILPVHLFGQPCAPAAVQELAGLHRIPVVEDAAQAFGAKTPLGPVGGLGTIACFSFFPSKNIGAFGDGGLVTTADGELAERVRRLRNHGAKPKYHHVQIGGNFRLDAIQAAVLRVKLAHLDRWIEARRRNAELYTKLFTEAGLPREVLSPPRAGGPGHVWNQYVIRTNHRDELRAHLTKKGIATEIHYPEPLHLQPCFGHLGYAEGTMPVAERACREVLSIPVFPELGEARVHRVAEEIVTFLRGFA
ncbi:MAG: DegT/DnrJ/EryC1/StrS family aminotransferase [Polyangiaceae bacterium]